MFFQVLLDAIIVQKKKNPGVSTFSFYYSDVHFVGTVLAYQGTGKTGQ